MMCTRTLTLATSDFPPVHMQLPFVDKGDPDESLANDPLGLKQLGKAFGFGKKKEEEQQQGGKKKGARK